MGAMKSYVMDQEAHAYDMACDNIDLYDTYKDFEDYVVSIYLENRNLASYVRYQRDYVETVAYSIWEEYNG